MECSQKTESHHAGTQSPIMLGVTVGGAGVEITSARNVGIEHLYAIYGGSMVAIVFIGLKLLWGPSIQCFRQSLRGSNSVFHCLCEGTLWREPIVEHSIMFCAHISITSLFFWSWCWY